MPKKKVSKNNISPLLIVLGTLIFVIILFFLLTSIIPAVLGYDFFVTQNGKTILTSKDIDKACETSNCDRIPYQEYVPMTLTRGDNSYTSFYWTIPVPLGTSERIDGNKPVTIYYKFKKFESNINVIPNIYAYKDPLDELYRQQPTENDLKQGQIELVKVKFKVNGRNSESVNKKSEKMMSNLAKICHFN